MSKIKIPEIDDVQIKPDNFRYSSASHTHGERRFKVLSVHFCELLDTYNQTHSLAHKTVPIKSAAGVCVLGTQGLYHPAGLSYCQIEIDKHKK